MERTRVLGESQLPEKGSLLETLTINFDFDFTLNSDHLPRVPNQSISRQADIIS